MLPKKIKNKNTDIIKQKFNNLNDCVIKIDYFDKKGDKNFENNIPLTYILNPVMELPKSNINPNYF